MHSPSRIIYVYCLGPQLRSVFEAFVEMTAEIAISTRNSGTRRVAPLHQPFFLNIV